MNPEGERIGRTEFLHSIEGFFKERDLATDGLWALAVFAGLAGIFVLAWWLQRRNVARRSNNPDKLFRSILRDLNLPVPQRDAIVRISRASELEHPLSLLICHNIYKLHAGHWLSTVEQSKGPKARETAAERVAHAEAALFSWMPGRESTLSKTEAGEQSDHGRTLSDDRPIPG